MCRNCDTAIEVSEGDVARFRTNPVFACSVCQQDLSQRMAEMLGRSPVVLGTVGTSPPPRLSDPDEFTVPDDEEAFDGLPMGESFDDAALRLKAVRNPATTPVMRTPEATPLTRTPQATPVIEDPVPEDPSMLALRIAGQAQAQAQALAEKASARAHPGHVTPLGAPDTAATEPGMPLPGGSPSTEVGVVPEEPENETTARARTGSAEGSVAEPTLPSDGGDDRESSIEHTASSVPDERTPLMSATPDDERSVDITRTPEISVPAFNTSGVLPSAPVNEATPSVSRGGSPVLVEEEPPREVTAKRSAPPPRIMRTTVPRTGTGPAGIGALGIRVVNNRAVVRPTSNGKSVTLPAPNAETQVSAIDIERPSAGSRAAAAAVASAGSAPVQPHHTPAVPFSSPRAGTQQRRQNSGVPMWAMIGGGGVVLAILAVFGLRATGVWGTKPDPTITPLATPTPDFEIPTEVVAVPTPTEARTATPATPAATPTAVLGAQTPRVTATPEPTPAVAISTPVARVSTTPAPTAVAIVSTPKPTPAPTAAKSSTTLAIEAARAKVSATRDYDGAMKDLYGAGMSDPAHMEELWDAAWAIGDRYGSKDLKLSIAKQYLPKFPNGRSAAVMKIYVERSDQKSATTPTATPTP